MTPPRPFRFAVQGRGAASGAEWVAKARKVEALGYAIFSVPDHFLRGLGPVAALAAAAAATTSLRLGSFVFAVDYRHPATLAQEAATIDLLSDGRLELGLGAGWLRAEYEAAGIPFDAPSVRIARLEEAVRLLKRLFGDEPVTSAGNHYGVTELSVVPKPVQRPHPPILIGGGGRRLLEVAAREADIVAFAPRALGDGTLDPGTITAAATARKAAWVRDAAGARFGALELNVFVYAVEVTDDRSGTADRLAADFGIAPVEVLDSPHVLIGSVDGIVEQLRERRERYGISYNTVAEDLADALAPIVAHLAAG